MKVLDHKGVQYLWKKIALEDYPNNETLVAVINAIDETKADKDAIVTQINDAIANYYTKTQIDTMEFITIEDIDEICGVLPTKTVLNSAILGKTTI